MRKLKAFLRDDRASFVPAVALIAVPLCLVVGLSVDLTDAISRKSSLQDVADAAALVAVTHQGDEREAEKMATDQIVGNDSPGLYHLEDLNITTEFNPRARQAAVRVTTEMPLTFLHLLGYQTITLEAEAVARKDLSSYCIYTLDPASRGALTVNSDGGLSAPDCGIQVNSSSSGALNLLGRGTISAAAISVVGGYQGQRYPAALRTQQSQLPDPLTKIRDPAIPARCDYDSELLRNATLPAGSILCGNIKISGDVTLSPGMHYFRGALVILDRDAKLSAERATMVLDSKSSLLQLPGDGSLSVSAPIVGEYTGIAIFGSRERADATPVISLSTNKNYRMDGTIYAPRHQVHLRGDADRRFESRSNSIISWQFSYSGASKIVVGFGGIPTPLGLGKPKAMLTR